MASLPEWMTERNACKTPVVSSQRPHRNTVRRALGALLHAVAEMLANDASAAASGLLQRIDARAKALGLIGLLVVITFVHGLPALALSYLGCLMLAVASRLPLRRLARVWLVVPLFSAGIMLPAMLNIVTPGKPLWTLWRFTTEQWGPCALPETLAVTDAGLLIAARFVLRVAVCVSLVLLLTATTRADRLFRGLRALGMPRVFVMLLTMMQRYLAVLMRAAEEIHLAKLSRTVAPGSTRSEQAWVAAGMGALFRRTRTLGDDITLAMLSRGYTGDVYLLDEPEWHDGDRAFIAAVVAVGCLLLLFGG